MEKVMGEHDAIREMLAGYALGALEGAEARAVKRHLPTCDDCRHTLAGYRQVTRALDSVMQPRVAPPHLEADLRARLAASRGAAGPARARRLGWRPLAVAASVALALGLGLWLALPRALPDPERRLAREILASDDSVRVALVADASAPDATGEAVLAADNRTMVVVVSGLADLPEDMIYQLWLVEGDRRDDGGTYWADEDIWVVRAPQALATYDALGVTVEPLGGSPAPTGPRVLSAALPSIQ